jgi:hypothetical protein
VLLQKSRKNDISIPSISFLIRLWINVSYQPHIQCIDFERCLGCSGIFTAFAARKNESRMAFIFSWAAGPRSGQEPVGLKGGADNGLLRKPKLFR